MADDPQGTPQVLGRQLALGFGAVSLVAVAMAAVLLSIISDVSGLVAGMQRDESSINQGLELATAVRELSLHAAHVVIEGDDSHLAHYQGWRDRVRARLQDLATRVPQSERWRLSALGEKTQRLHDVLMGSALPAAQRGDVAATRAAAQELDALGAEASAHADVLAKATASSMSHAHVMATDSTQRGLLVGFLGIALMLALAAGFTTRLRATVLQPLKALTAAAQRFGRGEFGHRVGPVGGGELAALGQAFDRMAEELGRREATMVRAERMAAIGQLAAGVAHELNNPIGIIRGYLKTMTPDEDAQTLREELAILDEEAGHCQRIAEDLLAYARTDQAAADRIQMAHFLQEAVTRFSQGLPAGAVQVQAQDAVLQGDGARLRQVLLNLLTNARQASAEGVAVSVRGSEDAGHYLIEVEDEGPGVAPEDVERIFEPFFSRRRGGSGLGLAVCQGIVKAHHGVIEVAPRPGGGSIFRVRLPLRRSDAAEVTP